MDSNNKNNNKIICTSKQTQIYEILNKIQNVINTESLIPRKFGFYFYLTKYNSSRNFFIQIINCYLYIKKKFSEFIYFAKTMEEMRKKWLQSEMRCKDLEAKLNVEKSMFQRKINELKYFYFLFDLEKFERNIRLIDLVLLIWLKT